MGRFSRFIKGSDLKPGDIVTFTMDGQWVDRDFSQAKDGTGKKKVFECVACINDGEAKEFIVNSTSGKNLDKAWGDSSWVGKKARVDFVKMLCFGEMEDVLVLEPV